MARHSNVTNLKDLISNNEHRISNNEVRTSEFDIQNSLFDIILGTSFQFKFVPLPATGATSGKIDYLARWVAPRQIYTSVVGLCKFANRTYVYLK